MKLHEHREFASFIDLTTQNLRRNGFESINAQIVEKDYWVTEVLRACAQHLGDRAIFKGGTSLSKAWDLIRRFSEDVDLFVQLDQEQLGGKKPNEHLKKLLCHVFHVEGLERNETESLSTGKYSRKDVFTYRSVTDGGGLSPTVILEAGCRSGTVPNEARPLNSMIAARLIEAEVSSELGDYDNIGPFDMLCLHPARTVIEKLFALHAALTGLGEGKPFNRQARHFYDVCMLLSDPGVQKVLRSPQLAEIRADVLETSRRFFSSSPVPTDGIIANSRVFEFDSTVDGILRQAYDKDCNALLLAPGPTWNEVKQVLAKWWVLL